MRWLQETVNARLMGCGNNRTIDDHFGIPTNVIRRAPPDSVALITVQSLACVPER